MTGVVDTQTEDRIRRSALANAYASATGRAAHLSRHELNRYVHEFEMIRKLTLDGEDTYMHWREIQDDSVLTAAYLEAVSSSRRTHERNPE